MTTNEHIKYNPRIHHRQTIRLKEYDYSQNGAYFVIICTHNRNCLFGNVGADLRVCPNKGEQGMRLNSAGEIMLKWWLEWRNKFQNIELDECVIMPNHLHGIIKISNKGEHIGSPLHKMIQWFKTMTTNEYIRGVKSRKFQPFDKAIWQRNYWEHVVRNDNELVYIREYIISNPCNWDKDALFVNCTDT